MRSRGSLHLTRARTLSCARSRLRRLRPNIESHSTFNPGGGRCHLPEPGNATILTRLVNFCWLLFRLCLFLAVAGAIGVGGYLYFRLDDEIRRQVEQRLADHYREFEVHVRSARFDQDQGIAVHGVTLSSRGPVAGQQPILSVDEMYLGGKLRMEDLLRGQLPIDGIVVRRATLRVVHETTGNWNVTPLLPLPNLSERSPKITIDDATILMADAANPAAEPWKLQGIRLGLTPVDPAVAAHPDEKRFRVEGTAAGLPARELHVDGLVGTLGELNVTIRASGLEVSSKLLNALPGFSASPFPERIWRVASMFPCRSDGRRQTKR